MEAATVRHVVFVVVLVGAAFLGGAFVNGPGLRWVQTQLLGSLGLGEEGEIASVDLKGAASPDGSGVNPAAGKTDSELARGLMAPAPSVVADSGAARPAPSELPPIRLEGTENEVARRRPASPPSSRSSSTPQSSASTSPPSRAPAVAAPAPQPTRAPVDADVALAAASSAAAPPPLPGAAAATDRGSRPALMDSLASLMPAPAPAPPDTLSPPVPAPAPPRPEPKPKKPGDDDWATLARKMQALGVTRFTIEGQPGGRVVFSCLIPVAGRQAVAQRFEAEGDDAVQAARAALRRVALWRAAQTPR
jgi:hypothetical protein